MIGINIYINQETQETLLKAAALAQKSVEELASSLLKESVDEKLQTINASSENQGKFPINPLREMQPYAYLADPSEAIISPDDWEINQEVEENYL